MDIPRNVEQRLWEFAPEAEIYFERIAVTQDQIAAWGLPTRPTKRTDTRARDFGGDESLRALEAKHGELPHTPKSLTGGGGTHYLGGGGTHYLFAHPGREIRNMVGDKDGKGGVAPGLDIRGDGGLIIAPGSRHISGGTYQWEVSAHPDDVPVAPLPGWLLNLLTAGPSGNGTAPRFSTAAVLAGVPEGQRDDAIFRLASRLRTADVPQDAAERLALEAAGTPPETFVGRRDGTIPNDIARLKGKRFVATAEAEEGKRLSESLIKRRTGRDTISARFMRGEWFDFRPEFKPWLATNHKPTVLGQDKAIWDRLKLIPFAVTIPKAEQDKNLPDRLREELPGVLRWAAEGCLEWQRDGLNPPSEVLSATARYRAEQDTIAAFIEDACTLDENAKATATSLYAGHRHWCQDNGEEPPSQTAFGIRLTERGLSAHRGAKGQRWWHGIGLLTQPGFENG